MIRMPKKLKIEGVADVYRFRQFESLSEACDFLGEDLLLTYLNRALMEHDRKKLRQYTIEGRTLDLELYKKEARFVSSR
jgi:hypothetical protein